MACFLVPVAEAIVTTIAEKTLQKHETTLSTDTKNKIPFSQKLKVLNGMLWGGSGLLAFEHLWHGEITPFFPFLTNATNPADFAEMMHEMATVGVCMSLVATAAWWISMTWLEKIRKKEISEKISDEVVT
ncbi:MAG: hypothetical protein K2O42_01865 [Oscillospiraceae bacterium]|nr:hypothetical protein [Oscillospiraceae bacterium]